VKLRPETFKILAEGLEECVRSGTGQGAAVEGVRVAGKTGTATSLDGSGATHAWFVGYAPADEPEIALVVFLERGTGAADAAPLAGRILRHYFTSKGQRP
jgi:cell division protein FtsI/penicillin-binding protein 2